MGKYSNGLETRNSILQTCREMFYENGYDNTTFKDISRHLDINQSAIHYHFKSKENIRQIIFEDTIRKNNDLVDFYSDRATCELAKVFFDIEIYMYKIWNDEKYRRFYLDATSDWGNEELDATSRIAIYLYEMSDKADDTMEEEDGRVAWSPEKKFMQLAVNGFDQTVLQHIDRLLAGDTEEISTLKDILDQVYRMYKKILGIGDEEYERAIADVRIMEDRCKWDQIDTTLEE